MEKVCGFFRDARESVLWELWTEADVGCLGLLACTSMREIELEEDTRDTTTDMIGREMRRVTWS